MGNMIELDVSGTKVPVYEAKPAGEVKGGLIVIHEVWGLANHIKNVADRFAAEGYYVVAPDLLAEVGINEELVGDLAHQLFDPERRTAAQPKLRELMTPMHAPDFGAKALAGTQKCFDYLYALPEVKQKVAIIGFCFGGTYSFSLAVHEPRLKAAAPFYGHADFSVDELKQIKCPVMAFYGENDENLMASLPQLKKDMQAAGVNFTAQTYKGAGHAFFNDSNPYAFNKAAATDAWPKVLAFLAQAI